MVKWSSPNYKPSESTHLTLIGEEGLLLKANTEECYQLNPVAVSAWRLINEGHSLEDCVAPLLAKFRVDEVTLRFDLEALVEDALSKDLIYENSHPSRP